MERPIAIPAEVVALIEAITPRYRTAVLIAAWCGLRRGEIGGLRVSDVDLINHTITVRKNRGRSRTPACRCSSRVPNPGPTDVGVPRLPEVVVRVAATPTAAISGGEPVAPGEFPWMVRLLPADCGGTLVHPQSTAVIGGHDWWEGRDWAVVKLVQPLDLPTVRAATEPRTSNARRTSC